MNEDNSNMQGANDAPVESSSLVQNTPVQDSNESRMQEYKNFYEIFYGMNLVFESKSEDEE